jgi:hypothetical protein
MRELNGDSSYKTGSHCRADNPYSLITIFGRGHLAIKAGGAVYTSHNARP